MSGFPTTQPPDIPEIIAYIRWWLGQLPSSEVGDSDMSIIVAMNIGKYGSDLCKITYYSTVDVLRWLIRKQAQATAGTGGSGALKRTKEQEGNVTVEQEFYDTAGGGATLAGWDKVLEDLLDNPTSIGCNPIDTATGGGTGAVIIGGGDHNGSQAVYESRIRRDKAAYDYRTPTNFPWRPSRY